MEIVRGILLEMYYKDFYRGLDEKTVEALVKKEGFVPMKFADHPGFVYTPHQHPETKLLAFLNGTMDVIVNNTSFECKKGDKLIIPGNIIHSATVGNDGCTYFWSEKMV